MARRKTPHDDLVAAVELAIETLFSDTSVSTERTKEDLVGIVDDCRMRIMAINETFGGRPSR